MKSLQLAQSELNYRIEVMEEKLGHRAELFQHLAKHELSTLVSWRSLLTPVVPGIFQTLREDDHSDRSTVGRFFSNFWSELKKQYQSKIAEWTRLFQMG